MEPITSLCVVGGLEVEAGQPLIKDAVVLDFLHLAGDESQ